jgi:hypothetical protein
MGSSRAGVPDAYGFLKNRESSWKHASLICEFSFDNLYDSQKEWPIHSKSPRAPPGKESNQGPARVHQLGVLRTCSTPASVPFACFDPSNSRRGRKTDCQWQINIALHRHLDSEYPRFCHPITLNDLFTMDTTLRHAPQAIGKPASCRIRMILVGAAQHAHKAAVEGCTRQVFSSRSGYSP